MPSKGGLSVAVCSHSRLPLPIAVDAQVALEDTVLFTVRMYCKRPKAERSPSQVQAIQQRLVPLIRCQHLSPFGS